MDKTTRREKLYTPSLFVTGVTFLLLVIAMFTNLGVTPLRVEEPRRALIALEMDLTHNLIVPKVRGEVYYNKPPLFSWVILASARLFGSYSEFAIRFPSVCSVLLMGVLMFVAGIHYVSLPFGIYSSLLFLVCGEFLFYFSLLGEIDLFYSLLTFGSFLALYVFYRSQHYSFMFLTTYGLAALGTLSKGLPSMVFLGISMLVFFGYKKDFRRLFTWSHLFGIVLYIGIVGGYFWRYSQYYSLGEYFRTLWWESMRRTVAAEKHRTEIFQHLVVFPFNIMFSLIPASLLVPFVVKKDLLKTLRKHPLLEFALMMFVGNFWVYWISPGARPRYIYMLYPFLVMILTYCYLQYAPQEGKIRTWLSRLAVILLGIIAVLGMSVPFIPALDGVPHLVVVAVITGGIGMLLVILCWKFPHQWVHLIVLGAILLRVIFDFTIIPLRAIEGSSQYRKQAAYDIVDITDHHPLFLFGPSGHFSTPTSFYLTRERGMVLTRKDEIIPDTFFLVDKTLLTQVRYTTFYSFTPREFEFVLVKFLPE